MGVIRAGGYVRLRQMAMSHTALRRKRAFPRRPRRGEKIAGRFWQLSEPLGHSEKSGFWPRRHRGIRVRGSGTVTETRGGGQESQQDEATEIDDCHQVEETKSFVLILEMNFNAPTPIPS